MSGGEKVERSLMELQARRALCLTFIQLVSETDRSNPLREGAIKEYNRQLAEIDKQIEAITGKPPDNVIGLKPGLLTCKSP